MDKTILVERVERRIFLIRGHKVMLDSDLAELYGVKPIRLREQMKRNHERFPGDFMFQLSDEEVEFLVSPNTIPSRKPLGGYLPYVFTQEGIAMLSSVLRSRRAVMVNIAIMRHQFLNGGSVFMASKSHDTEIYFEPSLPVSSDSFICCRSLRMIEVAKTLVRRKRIRRK